VKQQQKNERIVERKTGIPYGSTNESVRAVVCALERSIEGGEFRVGKDSVIGSQVGSAVSLRSSGPDITPNVVVYAVPLKRIGFLGRFKILERRPSRIASASHKGIGEERSPPRACDTRIRRPIPVMQRDLRMDLPQEFLQSIGQNAMPGNKCWP